MTQIFTRQILKSFLSSYKKNCKTSYKYDVIVISIVCFFELMCNWIKFNEKDIVQVSQKKYKNSRFKKQWHSQMSSKTPIGQSCSWTFEKGAVCNVFQGKILLLPHRKFEFLIFFSSLVFFTYCQNLITFNLDFKTYFKKDMKVFPG